MKLHKIAALLLALALTVSCAFAEVTTTTLSESETGLKIIINHEDTVTIETFSDENTDFVCWTFSDGVHAPVTVAIAPSEIEGALSMSDLKEEEKMLLGETLGQLFANPVYHVDITPSGNEYLHISSNEASDMDCIVTIYQGYFVELVQYQPDFSTLTDDDLAFCLSILHGIEFVNAAE